MARPEPNICSQKCGKGWPGARTSTWIVSALGRGFCDVDCCADAQNANEAIRDSTRNVCFIRLNLTEKSSPATEGLGWHKFWCRPNTFWLGCASPQNADPSLPPAPAKLR